MLDQYIFQTLLSLFPQKKLFINNSLMHTNYLDKSYADHQRERVEPKKGRKPGVLPNYQVHTSVLHLQWPLRYLNNYPKLCENYWGWGGGTQ